MQLDDGKVLQIATSYVRWENLESHDFLSDSSITRSYP